MWSIYGQKGIDYPEEQYGEWSDKVEHILRQTMIILIKDEKNVVVDFNFWNDEGETVLLQQWFDNPKAVLHGKHRDK